MTPNLRFNKKTTRELIKSISKEKNMITKTNIDWNWDNSNKIYGLRYIGWFKTAIFFLQKVDDDRYRLVVSNGEPICSFYLIDDLDEFLNVIGIEILDLDNNDEIMGALKETAYLPNTGILMIDDKKIYIYDHENYENT